MIGPAGFMKTVKTKENNMEWLRVEPPEGVLVEVKCSDYMGEWYSVAMRKDYKKPKKGQCKKGFRKGWRWVDSTGESFGDMVDEWRFIDV